MTWTNKERKEFERATMEAMKSVMSPEEYEKFTQTLKEVRKMMSTFKPKNMKNTRLTKDEQQRAETAQIAAKVLGFKCPSIETDEGREYPLGEV